MRLRLSLLVLCAAVCVAAPASATAQQQASQYDPWTDGLVEGDYLRVSVNSFQPINPKGGLHNWDAGTGVSVDWDDWPAGSNSVGRVGFGLGVDYTQLPFNASRFIADLQESQSVTATSASASKGRLLVIHTTIHLRLPVPYVVPRLMFGFGYLDFNPSHITYTTGGTTESVRQQRRRGADLLFGAGIDKKIFGPVAVFGDARYDYAFTSVAYGSVLSSGSCATTQSCEAFRNTQFGSLRGGLRILISQ